MFSSLYIGFRRFTVIIVLRSATAGHSITLLKKKRLIQGLALQRSRVFPMTRPFSLLSRLLLGKSFVGVMYTKIEVKENAILGSLEDPFFVCVCVCVKRKAAAKLI